MTDPIRQELGFDVKDALADLGKLNKRLKRLDTLIGTLGNTLSNFNVSGDKVDGALTRIAESAKDAEDAIKGLNKAQRQSSRSGGGSRGPSGPQGPDNSEQIADTLRNRFQLPDGASLLQQRSFESAIRKTADLASNADKSVNDVIEIMGGLRESFDTTDNKIADSIARIEKSFQSISKAADKNTDSAVKELDRLAKEANRNDIAEGLRRQFNIPADATISELRQFNNAIEQASRKAADAGKTVRDIPRLFKNTGAAFSGAENDIVNSLNKVENAFEKLGSNARREMSKLEKNALSNITRITVSFDTFVRIISTQLIIKALNNIQNSFANAARASIQFEKSIARIKTIADSELGSIDQIAQKVRGVSDAFGLDILTVSEGLYDRISNQIGNATDALSSLQEVAKFSVATNSELADGVGLVDSVINASGKTAEDTGEILGKFFRVIDLGRVNADQLRDTLGRVLPVGDELGVTYEEIGAALAEITVQGVNANEAFTQIRGILNALQKPTDAMKAALREMGFESSEAAVRALGLGGVLAELEKSTNGSATAFGKLFPNMRGIIGATILAEDSASRFEQTLSKINNTTAALNDEKFRIVFDTDASRVERDINKIRNAIQVDLGKSVVTATSALFQLVGGADAAIATIKFFIPVITSAGAAMAVMAARAGLAQLEIIKLKTALGDATLASKVFTNVAKTLAISGIVFTVGTTIGNAIGNAIGKAIFDDGKKALEDLRKEAERRLKDIKQDFDLIGQQGEVVFDAARRALRDFVKESADELRDLERTNDQVLKRVSNGVEQIVKERQRLVSQLERAAGASADAVIESQKRVEKELQKREDRRLDRRLSGLSPEFQAAELQRESRRLTSAANAEVTKALKTGDPRDLERAIALFDRAEDVAERVSDIAGDTGNLVAQKNAERLLDRLSTQRLNAERQIQKAKEAQSKQNFDAARVVRESNDEVEKQAAFIKENLSALKDVNLSDAERADRLKDISDSFEKIQKAGFSDNALNLLKQLGLEDFLNTAQAQLGKEPLALQFEADAKALNNVEQQIKEHFKGLRIAVPGLEFLAPDATKTPEVESALNDASSVLQRQTNAAENILKSREQRDTQAQLLSQLIPSANDLTSVDDLNNTLNTFSKGSSAQSKAIADAARLQLDFRKTLTEATQTGNFTPQVLQQLTKTAIDFKAAMEAGGKVANNLFTEQDSQILQSGVQGFQKVVEQQQTILNNVRALAQDPSIKAFIEAQPLDSDAQKALQTINLMKQPSQDAGAAYRREVEAAVRAAKSLQNTTPTAPATPQGFNSGGFPRGKDVIPAALAPGEAVINPRSTRQFFTQLQAMNAGQTPVFRDSGSVTNVGDINVNVNNHGGQPVSGRQIALDIRRELRRGTSKIR